MGGGSGSSGKADFPEYMKDSHHLWLAEIEAVLPTVWGADPLAPYSAYDPDITLADIILLGNNFLAYIDGLISAPGIAAAVTAFDNALTAQYTATSVARFEAGMRSINAVQSSSFVVGKAIMLARKDEQVARYAAELNLNAVMRLSELKKAAYVLLMEGYKLSLIAKKEEYSELVEMDVRQATWRLDLYHYGANMLGVLGSGAIGMNPTRPNKTQTAIGGAMTGMAAGAMIGSAVPGVGTAVGAAVGFVAGGIAGYVAN